MKKFSIHSPKLHLWFIRAALLVMIGVLFVEPGFVKIEESGENLYTVILNGETVGQMVDREEADAALARARRRVASEREEILYLITNLEVKGESVLTGRADDVETVSARMEEVLRRSEDNTLTRAYTVKIGQRVLTLAGKDDITALLTMALRVYDPEGTYELRLVPDNSRQIDVLGVEILSEWQQAVNEEKETRLPTAGINEVLSDILNSAEPVVGMQLSDYKTGLTDIGFVQSIEVTESFVPANRILSFEEAATQILEHASVNKVHEVVAGDTLSQIAASNDMSLADLLAMNPNFSSADAMIRVGDRINVTAPEQILAVHYSMQTLEEQEYEEDIIYIDNPDWYTNQSEVVQQPSSGFRKIVAKNDYVDGSLLQSSVVQQEVVAVAVPKIVERGTKVLPHYIWPVSGGSISSSFGRRSRPKAGASTNHQGVDIAVSTGTTVMASSAGTVVQAGWQGGYGYVVFINHADGRQTRYGHLSKVLVKTGQTVSQGQKIALSGNTGNSTGPHLHFELRIGGQAVNPLNYTN